MLLIFVMDPGIVVVVIIIIIILFFLQLYTVSTLVLVFQCVYYDYIRRWSKYRQINSKHEVQFNFLAPKSILKAFSYNQPFLTGLLKVTAHVMLFILKKIISRNEKIVKTFLIFDKIFFRNDIILCALRYTLVKSLKVCYYFRPKTRKNH